MGEQDFLTAVTAARGVDPRMADERTYCLTVNFRTCSAYAIEVDGDEAHDLRAIGEGALAGSTNSPCEAAKDALGAVMPEEVP